MNLRVQLNDTTGYRVTNWAEQDRAVVRRGDVTLCISEYATATWKPTLTGRRGAQRKFSHHAIESALTLRQIFKLPLRQARGFLTSVLSLTDVDPGTPDLYANFTVAAPAIGSMHANLARWRHDTG